jgi:hypothetical protein
MFGFGLKFPLLPYNITHELQSRDTSDLKIKKGRLDGPQVLQFWIIVYNIQSTCLILQNTRIARIKEKFRWSAS